MYDKNIIVALATTIMLVDSFPLLQLRAQASDFGSCSNPTIQFAVGLDGRTEASFAPNNLADFNHGSALNIGVISSFICSELGSSCKADATAISDCDAGQTAASTLTGQAAADAFNAAITRAGGSALPSTGAPAPRAAAASGANLQTFTGALGGAPPPVVAGGKGFIVDGSQFINEAGALGRSCDVQHNACADAANSGSATFSVSQCDTQDTACKAAITA